MVDRRGGGPTFVLLNNKEVMRSRVSLRSAAPRAGVDCRISTLPHPLLNQGGKLSVPLSRAYLDRIARSIPLLDSISKCNTVFLSLF